MDNEEAERSCIRYIHRVHSLIGVCVGLSASAVFFFFLQISLPETGTWAFTSAVFAAVCYQLHMLHRCNLLSVWHTKETLQQIYVLGLLVLLIGSAFGIWYLFVGIYYHKDLHSIQDNPYLSSVWAFMTAKWGMFIMIASRKYARLLSSDVPLLRAV